MKLTKILMVLLAVTLVSACGGGSKFKSYNGPEVTQVIVDKDARRMYLMHNKRVLKHYPVQLGFQPDGHKQREGDGRTPEGHYLIDKRNPNSKFHLSIGINYPNERDIANALALGRDPGGDIFVHGGPPKGSRIDGSKDWTWGCIAVTDKQIERIYAMVENGTPIYIKPSRKSAMRPMLVN
ncbi:L,D-transpeptidase catalytic domain [Roseivivax marinus]|uniref:L,D-transpeptidase family protein n=1 Tax=Roseivivax marinus TaxID=1379903 RepID=UPI0008BDFDE0|nr:L,D-transpeptidase family protein [Roseivivax marinus]SEK21327.1 L,D-transpeptidase catalytic domain [Roseivivax marinus]